MSNRNDQGLQDQWRARRKLVHTLALPSIAILRLEILFRMRTNMRECHVVLSTSDSLESLHAVLRRYFKVRTLEDFGVIFNGKLFLMANAVDLLYSERKLALPGAVADIVYGML